MISLFHKIALVLLLAGSLTACGGSQSHKKETDTACKAQTPDGNAVYYWRTTFKLTPVDKAFLQRHTIRRIYLRMFDVAAEFDPERNCYEAVPIATTRFVSEGLPPYIPEGVEIVPTVYITLDALRAMQGEEPKYAELIVERLRAMSSYNDCGAIREMQFDCDWTASTRASYEVLCRAACEQLRCDSIALSATIRLHQLSEPAPPVSRGVLMLYNTGALKNPDTRNSILDMADVRPYLRRNHKYAIPLDYAWPVFGWGVIFHDGKFQRIVSHPESETLVEGDTLRIERPTVNEVLEVKALVEKVLGPPAHGNILYHLDNEQQQHYTDHEIAEIYARH